jgi:tRNA dimethylallyltransferase
MISSSPALIAIVGETGTGKSALALTLAHRYNGEIICADSRTIYRGLDIGTAKPLVGDQQSIPHHLLDILDPTQSFSAAQFKILAQAAIDDISKRGKLPILVGGTGLYVNSLLFNYEFLSVPASLSRPELAELSVAELQSKLQALAIPLPANDRNPRHLIRSLETAGQLPQPHPLRDNTILIGLLHEPSLRRTELTQRVDAMIQAGLEQEARRLSDQYGWQCEALNTIGYQEWREYFEGTIDAAEVRRKIIRDTVLYAKRQRTWFKRNKSIQWFYNREDKAISVVIDATLS